MNLFTIIKACEKTECIQVPDGQIIIRVHLKYKDLKEVAAEALVELTRPFRVKREELRRRSRRELNRW